MNSNHHLRMRSLSTPLWSNLVDLADHHYHIHIQMPLHMCKARINHVQEKSLSFSILFMSSKVAKTLCHSTCLYFKTNPSKAFTCQCKATKFRYHLFLPLVCPRSGTQVDISSNIYGLEWDCLSTQA